MVIPHPSDTAAAQVQGTSRWHSGAWCGASGGNGVAGKPSVPPCRASRPRGGASLRLYESDHAGDEGEYRQWQTCPQAARAG